MVGGSRGWTCVWRLWEIWPLRQAHSAVGGKRLVVSARRPRRAEGERRAGGRRPAAGGGWRAAGGRGCAPAGGSGRRPRRAAGGGSQAVGGVGEVWAASGGRCWRLAASAAAGEGATAPHHPPACWGSDLYSFACNVVDAALWAVRRRRHGDQKRVHTWSPELKNLFMQA